MILRRRKSKKRFSRLRARGAFLKKGVRFVPHLFTLGNAFFGFCSLVLAAHTEFVAAGYSILLAAMMDALDGRIARFLGEESLLGVQLDSLSDAVSFCLAPAFLMYMWRLKAIGYFGIIVGAIFMLCGLLRLARFNLIHEQQTIFFLGVPTTIAGCFLVSVVLNTQRFAPKPAFVFSLAGLVLFLAWLMISQVQFPSFKQKILPLRSNVLKVVFVFTFALIAVMRFEIMLLALLSGYFVLAFVYNVIRIKKIMKGI